MELQRGSALKQSQDPARVNGFTASVLPVSLKKGRATPPL